MSVLIDSTIDDTVMLSDEEAALRRAQRIEKLIATVDSLLAEIRKETRLLWRGRKRPEPEFFLKAAVTVARAALETACRRLPTELKALRTAPPSKWVARKTK
jgi:hypothetical protein